MAVINEQLNIVGNFRQSLSDISSLSRGASASMTMLGSIASSIGLGLSITAIAEMSDAVSLLNQRMKLATIGGEEFSGVQDKLRNKARETRASYESLASTFSKLGMQTKGVFANNDELIEFTGNLQKLFTVSGLDATGIESTMYNLTQSLSSGALMGQDYRILKQNAPQMIQILQDYYKVSRQELDNMVSAGKVSAQDLKNAMLDVSQGGMKDVVEQFNTMPVTFKQSITMLGDSLKQELEPMLLGAGKAAKFLADNIGIVSDTLKIAIIYVGMLTIRMAILKAMSAGGVLGSFLQMLQALIPALMGSSAGMSALTFATHGFKEALISTGIGAIPVIIGIIILLIGKLIDKLGGIKAVALMVKDAFIIAFETVASFIFGIIEGIINTFRKVKSFITDEKFEEFKMKKGVDEEAHKKRLEEIKAEQEKYRNKNSINNLNASIDGFSPQAQSQMTNSVKLAEEDVKYISDLASRKYVMQVNVNAQPNVSITQNTTGNGASNVGEIERAMLRALNNGGVNNYV